MARPGDSTDLPNGVELRPCDAEVDGPFIRDLTRANFFETMSRTVGWDEERHQREPAPAESYRVVYERGERIGFFSVREEEGRLYLKTIQLHPMARGRGLGTALMRYVEALAGRRGASAVRLRVSNTNPAMALCQRLGYGVVESDRFSHIMEKGLGGRPGEAE